MTNGPGDPIFGAAILKLSMAKRGLITEPGFRVVYAGTLRELGLKDSEVEEYIARNRDILEKHIAANRPRG
jgi:hypothetical protein